MGQRNRIRSLSFPTSLLCLPHPASAQEEEEAAAEVGRAEEAQRTLQALVQGLQEEVRQRQQQKTKKQKKKLQQGGPDPVGDAVGVPDEAADSGAVVARLSAELVEQEGQLREAKRRHARLQRELLLVRMGGRGGGEEAPNGGYRHSFL